MRKTARFLTASLMVCASLLGAALASAQDATAEATEAPLEITVEATAEATPEITETPITDLTYNTPVIGRISSDTPSQDWPLPLESADRLTILVERVDGNLVPSVILLDADGNEVNNSYGAESDYATAILESVSIEEAGDFTVRVEREFGVDGLTEGLYRLTIVPLAVALETAPNTEVVGEIEASEPVEGSITAEHWSHRYTYTAEAADSIRVIAERTAGNLEPFIQIFDSQDSSIATGYPETSGDIATADRINLSEAGEYTIVVSRYSEFDGWTEGDYRLTVEMIGSGEGSPNLSGITGEVTYDTPLEGEITPERWYQDWTLAADAGDTITIRAERVEGSGNLQPEVVLLGGSGQEITRGYIDRTGDHAEIDGRTLDGPGEYTVRVTRRSDQTGESSGAYTLLVTLDGSGEGSPALQGTTGTVAVGEPVEGEITNARWADSWSFSGTADQSIQVTVERIDGTLVPRLQIRDRNGQPLRDAYPEETRDIATFEYTPPTTGEYLIVVMRDREQDGATTGTYELTVSPAKD